MKNNRVPDTVLPTKIGSIDKNKETIVNELFTAILCEHGDLVIIRDTESNGWMSEVLHSPYGLNFTQVSKNLLDQSTESFRFDGSYSDLLSKLIRSKYCNNLSCIVNQARAAFGYYPAALFGDEERGMELLKRLGDIESPIFLKLIQEEKESKKLRLVHST